MKIKQAMITLASTGIVPIVVGLICWKLGA